MIVAVGARMKERGRQGAEALDTAAVTATLSLCFFGEHRSVIEDFSRFYPQRSSIGFRECGI